MTAHVGDYKYQMRRRRRGLHCLINGGTYGKLCGCGHREPPGKKDKTRVVRRILNRELQQRLREDAG